MIRVNVLYPNMPGVRFDMTYYMDKHIPLVKKLLKPVKVTVDKGLAGGAPDAPAPFVAIAGLWFNSMEDFQAAFAPASEELLGDIPKYTDIQAVLQISEVLE